MRKFLKYISAVLCAALALTLVPGLAVTVYATTYTSGTQVDVRDLLENDILERGVVLSAPSTHALSLYVDGVSIYSTNPYTTTEKYKVEYVSNDNTKYILHVSSYFPRVTGVTLDKDQITLETGGSASLKAEVSPAEADDKTVSWSVSGDSGAVKLYSDSACTQEADISGFSDMLTVYVKGEMAGSATVTVTTNDGSKTASCIVSVSQTAQTVTAPAAAQDLVYDGSEKTLLASPAVVTAGNKTAGSITYSVDNANWSAELPKAVDAGTYSVYYKVAGDSDYSEYTAPEPVSVTIARADPETPSGLNATVGQTLRDVALPDGWSWTDDTQSVGEEGSNTFTANYTSPDTNHNSLTGVELSVTVKKQPAVLKTPPVKADDFEFDGKTHNLIKNKGEAEGGEIVFAVASGSAAPADSAFSTAIPTAADPGTYKIWYKVRGDGTHSDTAPQSLTVTVTDVSFYVSKGDKQKYKKKDITITFKKEGENEESFDYEHNFVKASIKGPGIDRDLKSGEYDTDTGSLELTIFNSILKNLKSGKYTVTVYFIDEAAAHSASAVFTVPSGSGGDTPDTKDAAMYTLAIILFLSSLTYVVTSAVYVKSFNAAADGPEISMAEMSMSETGEADPGDAGETQGEPDGDEGSCPDCGTPEDSPEDDS